MVVYDFDVVGIAGLPFEANPPLIVDADTVLAFANTPELFQSIPRRHPQVRDLVGGVEHQELTERTPLHGTELPDGPSRKETLRIA